eukprot:CAMPEP_0198321878 /NCGR_PEP_ID=MMETSP1450-20131203/10502_1 /TAXON_ID=753684 ORGANISM="Madagascaria erythrocladiodes, Strain CCMP3234" /NCGR_SAMPLE_ID=MMETSP1450 /ASSEMBLY_ACC=CAM_ASM_001115 /LENGTH=110 /DNA_ID=CAMNT_0044025463 /DNA_START=590 /DNA_END=918 /DNA_ORIENTATION=-
MAFLSAGRVTRVASLKTNKESICVRKPVAVNVGERNHKAVVTRQLGSVRLSATGMASPEPFGQEKHATTLLDRLGGPPAIANVVDVFYQKVPEDERIAHFFEGVELEKLR